jgi:hypothetical protein
MVFNPEMPAVFNILSACFTVTVPALNTPPAWTALLVCGVLHVTGMEGGGRRGVYHFVHTRSECYTPVSGVKHH